MAKSPMAKPRAGSRPTLTAISLLALLTLAMFGDMLFWGGSRVLGNGDTDLFLQFVSWRDFGFSEFAHGNFPLWNPHIYSGAPFFGGLQAALLYLPNILFLFLPVPVAINWSIALHVLLIGIFTYLWVYRRGLHPAAAFLSGAMMMFCGPHFLHIYAGHLTNLCAMVWTPLIFLAIDGFFDRRTLLWCLLGMFAVAMQIFAGHPQYLFYTAISAGLYSALRLIGEKPSLRLIGGLAAIYPGGAALAAVQLLTGMQASGETIRNVSLPYQFASMFSFPPENLLTFVAPGFFGDMTRFTYWGRCYLWEMSVFFGITGLVLAIYGAVRCKAKAKWIVISLPLLLLFLALGVHTPIFTLLYEFVPGFDKFRSISKFIFEATLFFTLLAAMGFDHLLGVERVERAVVFSVLGGGCALCFGALWVWSTAWQSVVLAVQATTEPYITPATYNRAGFMFGAQDFSSAALLIGAGVCFVLAGLLALVRVWRGAVYAIATLAVLEVFVFAWNSRDTFDSAGVLVPQLKQFLDSHPGDYRIMNPQIPNSAMSLGAQDIWGADPGVVRRYAEFIAFTQGLNPDEVTQYVSFARRDPLLTLLRLRFEFSQSRDKIQWIMLNNDMPRLQLVHGYRVLQERGNIFQAMRSASFNMRKDVVLESEPDPKPDASAAPGDTVRLVGSDTDSLTIEADLQRPAILLITDVYTPAWRAVALPGSVQAHYDLQPADYALRSVAMAAGHHRLRVEYAPRAFRIGKWISILSTLLFCAALAWTLRQMRLQKPAPRQGKRKKPRSPAASPDAATDATGRRKDRSAGFG